MPKPQLSKKFLNQLYDMNILDPDQDPMEQFRQMQNIQQLYDSGQAPMESITDPDLKKSQATATPSSSTHSKQSTQDPVQTLFTDRARKLETDKKEREATEKAQRKAKALAKKEATSLQQGAAMSKQAKYAAEERERVQKQIEVDKVERREREELRKEAVRAGFDSHGSRTSKLQVLPQSSRGHSSGTKSIRSRRRDQSNIFVDRAPSPPSSSRSRPAYSANDDLVQDATNGDYAAGELADEPSTSEDYVPHGRNRDSAGRSRPQISLPTRTSLSRSGNRKPGRPTSDDDDDDESRYCMTCVKARFGLKKAIYVGNGQWQCEGPCGGSGAMVETTETSVPGWDWAEQETRDRMKRRFHSSLLMRGEVDAARDRSPSSVTRGDSVSSMVHCVRLRPPDLRTHPDRLYPIPPAPALPVLPGRLHTPERTPSNASTSTNVQRKIQFSAPAWLTIVRTREAYLEIARIAIVALRPCACRASLGAVGASGAMIAGIRWSRASGLRGRA
ncbi:MAG: hypothetical protein Q9161_006134 [Pseudevernia consocians]